MPKPDKKPKSTIRYVNRSRTPNLRHYPVSQKPLFAPKQSITEPRFHTVVRIDGYVWDYSKEKWKKEQRYVTLAHNEQLTRGEIEEKAENICQATSEHFNVRESTIVEGRRNPIYEEVSS